MRWLSLQWEQAPSTSHSPQCFTSTSCGALCQSSALHQGVSGTVILADPLPALGYTWDLSLHLGIIRLASMAQKKQEPIWALKVPLTFLEKMVCSPHCFVQINPVGKFMQSAWEFAGKFYSSELNFTEITTWDKSSIKHLWKWAWVDYEKDSRF